jgi:23S rRNA pseudouridine1911/1915/1917 synthase
MEAMEPSILFEDTHIVVIDKPAGLIVHNGKDSVAAWLSRHDPAVASQSWPDPARAGIIHRLDQDTSGVLVLAKTPTALFRLQDQFRLHTVNKVYRAIVFGHPQPAQGSVDVPVGRDPRRKTPMAVVRFAEVGRGKLRSSRTDYRVIEQLPETALVEAIITTGRTHQIRLHMKYLGHPILGDDVYYTKPSRNASKSVDVPRLLLYAKVLRFTHPVTGRLLTFEAPVPADFAAALDRLRTAV